MPRTPKQTPDLRTKVYKKPGPKPRPAASPIDLVACSGKNLKDLALIAQDVAMATLVHICVNGSNEAARVAAAKEICFRATDKQMPTKMPTKDDGGKNAEDGSEMPASLAPKDLWADELGDVPQAN